MAIYSSSKKFYIKLLLPVLGIIALLLISFFNAKEMKSIDVNPDLLSHENPYLERLPNNLIKRKIKPRKKIINKPIRKEIINIHPKKLMIT